MSYNTEKLDSTHIIILALLVVIVYLLWKKSNEHFSSLNTNDPICELNNNILSCTNIAPSQTSFNTNMYKVFDTTKLVNSCPDGTNLVHNVCTPVVCPVGTLFNGNCITCPTGTILNMNNGQCQSCPPGQYILNGNCVPNISPY